MGFFKVGETYKYNEDVNEDHVLVLHIENNDGGPGNDELVSCICFRRGRILKRSLSRSLRIEL